MELSRLQKRLRLLIEQGEYEKATEVFLFETGAKVSINYKGSLTLFGMRTHLVQNTVYVYRGEEVISLSHFGET